MDLDFSYFFKLITLIVFLIFSNYSAIHSFIQWVIKYLKIFDVTLKIFLTTTFFCLFGYILKHMTLNLIKLTQLIII